MYVCGQGGMTHPWLLKCLAAVLLLLWNLGPAAAQCNGELVKQTSFNETDAPGLVLLNVSAIPAETWSLRISAPSPLLEPYFRVEKTGGVTTLVLNQTLDLETVRDLVWINGGLINTITFVLTCKSPTSPSVDNEIYASVIPVNEFAPEFVNLPIDGFNVSEAFPVDSTALTLVDYVKDEDLTPNHVGYDFSLIPFSDPSVDGISKFEVSDSLRGTLSVKTVLDYEAMQPDKAFYILNVLIGDREGMTSTGTVRINIRDADDQNPEFWYPGCHSTCFTTYSATIDADFQGAITWLSPAPINARDLDSMNSPINYNFKQGDPDNFSQYLSIDKLTGIPSVIKPVTDFNIAMFTIIVEAVENSTKKNSEQTTLWLQIRGRNATSPTQPPVNSGGTFSTSSTPFRVAAIVLGVFFGLALILLVVFILCAIVSQKGKTSPVLPRAIAKLQTGSVAQRRKEDAEGTGGGGEGARVVTLRKVSGDSGVDFIRSLSSPTAAATSPPTAAERSSRLSTATQRPTSSIIQAHELDFEHMAGTAEIDYDHEGPEEEEEEEEEGSTRPQSRSRVSTMSGSELVPFEDVAGLVGSAQGMGLSTPRGVASESEGVPTPPPGVASESEGVPTPPPDYDEGSVSPEEVGVSNPAFDGYGEDSVDVSVVPMEQAHIVI